MMSFYKFVFFTACLVTALIFNVDYAYAQTPACTVAGDAGNSYLTCASGTCTRFMCDGTGYEEISSFSTDGTQNIDFGDDGATCTAERTGRLRYDGVSTWEFCNGSAWGPFEQAGECTSPALCPNIGDVCDDSDGGTSNDPIFAGFIIYQDSNSTDFGVCKPIYVTDDNQSTASQWKTSVGTDDITTDSYDDGALNVGQITVSTTFPAFKLCDDLTDGGFSDWYLPARNELNLLYQNSTAIDANAAGSFTTSAYWSSTEINGSAALDNAFNVGDISGRAKNTDYDVRCVRRD